LLLVVINGNSTVTPIAKKCLYNLRVSDNFEIKFVHFYPCPFYVTSVTHIFPITHKAIDIPRHFSLWYQIDLDIGKSHTQGQVPGSTTVGIRATEMTVNLSECNVRHA